MNRIVYVNGDYMPEQDAKISIFDRGFIFGDGIYEVIPVIKGNLVDKKYFMERLERSLGEVKIDWPCSRNDYVKVMRELARRNNIGEGIVYSQVTRGVADRNYTFPEATPPSFIAFTSSMQLLENPQAKIGIAVVTMDDLRWKRRDIKSLNLLAQCLAKQEAAVKGASEGWMVEDGQVTEGVSSTAFIVKNGKVITRPLSNSILPGIRRRTLLDIAGRINLEIVQQPFTVAEALLADEAFISSATTIVMPVVSIDDIAIGDGVPGPITTRLRALYVEHLLQEADSDFGRENN